MSLPATSIVEHHQGSVFTTALQAGATDPTVAQSEAEKKEIERLRQKHPDYQNNEEHWQFLLSSYEGGPGYVCTDTLFKHQREQNDDFKDRLKRAHYQNYCQPIVDFVPEYIFNHPIERDAKGEVKPLFDKFALDVDRNGTDLDRFMRAVAEDARLFGHCFVQVDKPALPAGREPGSISQLESDQLQLGSPYLVLVSPLEVFDWRTDKFGNYIYLKRVEYVTIEDGEDAYDAERYTEWRKDSLKITTVDVTDPQKPKLRGPADKKANPFKVVPFVQVFHKRSKSNRNIGISAVNDIAYQNRDVFNLTSLIGEFLYRQCFNILLMEEDTTVPERSTTEGAMGTSNVMTYPTGVKNPPQYLSPPSDPATFIQSERDKAIQEMYRQAAQDISSELFSVSNRSGDAAKQAFGRTIPVIAKAADTLQQAEIRILTLWAQVQNKKWDGKVAYKDSFEITNLQDLLLQLTTIFNTLRVMSPTFIREEWRRIVREFDGRIPRETLDKIFKEIDDIKDEDLIGYYKSVNDIKAEQGLPSSGQLMQGRRQSALGSDRKISLATGNSASNKERVPDNKTSKK